MYFRNPVFIVIVGIIILAAVAGAAFLLMGQNQEGAPSQNITPTTPPGSTSPTPAIDMSNWETYINEDENWQIDYPANEVEVATHSANQIGPNGTGKVVAFSHLGPTQTEGTEFFDGYSVTVGLKQKPANQNLREFVIEDSDPGPAGEVSDPKSVTINGHAGYEVISTGLGEAKIIYLQYPVRNDRVYYISIFSTAPQEREQEFDAIVEAMLQSFRSFR